MKVLLLGSGGREHALAEKLVQSSLCTQLFVAPGNPGTRSIATNVPLDILNADELALFIRENQIALVLVGPEQALVEGMYEQLQERSALDGCIYFGPGKVGAQLEGSKDFAKQFMQRHSIPTAKYKTFQANQLEEAKSYLEATAGPYVLKADGLAAGKGVIITESRQEAIREIEELLGGKFGAASTTVVIEEFLSGIEFSVFVATNGKDYAILPEAKDYKRIGEGDTGLNTGGMGSISPVPFLNESLRQKVLIDVVEPTLKGLQLEGIEYTGFLFLGLILVEGEVFVIEYNVRMGDPETQSVMSRIDSDFLELLVAFGKGEKLPELRIKEESAATVVLVSEGYPGSYPKGRAISGLEGIERAHIYHAGTTEEEGQLRTSGGRVIAVTALGKSASEALTFANEAAGRVQFEGKYFRKDIGKDLL